MSIDVLFVDDDQKILDGLRRTLRPLRYEWNIRFASSGDAGLRLLEEAPADIVVADMRMPGMNGTEFLDAVARRWPATARLALSGDTDRDAVSCSTAVTHQFLSKPCDIEMLRNSVARTIRFRRRIDDPDLVALIGSLDNIPCLPEIYVALTDEINSPHCSIAGVGRIVEQDMGMTAKLLQLVNSSYFGLPNKVTSASTAAAFLGTETLKALVLGLHLFDNTGTTSDCHIDLSATWARSLAVAGAASYAARIAGMDEPGISAAYSAGLLHEMGAVILLANLGDCAAQPTTPAEALGLTTIQHTDVAAYLLSLWGLPENLVDAVAFHAQPAKAGRSARLNVLTCAHIGAALAMSEAALLPIELDTNYLEQVGACELAGAVSEFLETQA
ncbi:MAG: HDOD domain-containing protein [Gammaproteobacteria bacterium]|nr:HDOD domain-containing protein [Gammaproteobacteria bacterium]